MEKIRLLLAGEPWLSSGVHIKGFDRFFTADYAIGIATLKQALEGSAVELHHLPGHLVPVEFPSTLEALGQYDVAVLSDIGSNSLLLHPDYLLGYNETLPKPDATVLLKTGPGKDAHPLLAVANRGAGRTMPWTSDIGPHWLPKAFSDWKDYPRFLAAGLHVAGEAMKSRIGGARARQRTSETASIRTQVVRTC